MSYTDTEYGVFLPNAAGGWLISTTAPYPPADYEYNKRVAVMSESIGLDFVMAMAKWRGFGGTTDHWGETIESVTMMAGIAEATSRVKIWATIHANMQNPAFAAKVFTTLQQISNGRAGMNIVSGSYADEFEQMGIWDPELTHAARYRMTQEWTSLVRRLWQEDSVTYDGEFFTLADCESRPHPKTMPTIISAGRSETAMAFQGRHADGAFLGAESLEDMAVLSRTVHDQAAKNNRAIKTYSMLTVVLDETDAAAEKRADAYGAGLDRHALANMRSSWGWDPQKALSWAADAPGREAFQTPYVTGDAATVTQRIQEIITRAELDGLMLIFPDYLEDLPVFGADVLPALRTPRAAGASA